MKRYLIKAKRPEENVWSDWTEIDDANDIYRHVANIKQLGYEAKVEDPLVRKYEQDFASGAILRPRVKIGDAVYAVNNDEDCSIQRWIVKIIMYDNLAWRASPDGVNFYEADSDDCILFLGQAKEIRQMRLAAKGVKVDA